MQNEAERRITLVTGMEHPASGRRMTRADARQLAAVISANSIDAICADPTNAPYEQRAYRAIRAAMRAADQKGN